MFLISSLSAKSYGVLPFLSLAFLFAPLETKYLTMSILPQFEAKCNGVNSSLSFAFIFEPLEIRYSAIAR